MNEKGFFLYSCPLCIVGFLNRFFIIFPLNLIKHNIVKIAVA